MVFKIIVNIIVKDKIVVNCSLDKTYSCHDYISRDPKGLVATKVIMETEVTEVRRVTEALLVFRVFLGLL